MGYRETAEVIKVLNEGLETLNANDEPILLDIDGRPVVKVHSFNPLAYETYGIIRNRAPHIVGQVALRGFAMITSVDSPDVRVITCIQVQDTGYGIAVKDIGSLVRGVGEILGYDINAQSGD